MGFRSGAYCPLNNAVYIAMSEDGVAAAENAYILRINRDNTTSIINPDLIKSKSPIGLMYTNEGKIIFTFSSVMHTLNPLTDTIETETISMPSSGNIRVITETNTFYLIASTPFKVRFPIVINEPTTSHPAFNHYR